MTGSLFDNRYQYDYIYPRGRSGETLRAVDMRENNRPVVIKRPAPQDAPPIRFGQEVSILNERKALTRLSGHAVITGLVGSGQFTIGGIAHQYIVMDRAQGAIVADMVLELAQRGERLPELEMLVIVDSLLDLLFTAHAHDIVYNDVDAKHLFWDRDAYRLKVIDWGNAVFLEGDEVTAQGISRQTDVFQVGELLFFILTGGSRLEVPRDAGEDFRVNFGHDSERIYSRLQQIVSRAAHPNPRLRYGSIAELRKDLSDYRAPLERERNAILGRVNDRLRRELSKDELNGVLKLLEGALALDPGYPPSRQARDEILNRLSDLEIEADLDAARIYLESGNWTRAISVLDELNPRARGDSATLIGLLLDWSRILVDSDVRPVPPAILDAVTLIFENHPDRAAYRLLTENQHIDAARNLQYLLAERITAHMPDILLLRPNLYRLEVAMAGLAADGMAVTEPRAFLIEINRALERLSDSNDASLIRLRDGYQSIVEQLTALSHFLETVRDRHSLANSKLPLSSLERALNAAMALADNMHVIGKQATGSPRDALSALDSARAIDPSNRSWEAVRRMIGSLYELLGSYQAYKPSADASDLEDWLRDAQAQLEPYVERLFDETLVGMVLGLRIAAQSWTAYAEAVIQGNRVNAIAALAQATDSISTVSPSLAGWLSQLRSVVNNAAYIERHALYGGLGRALADGWENFDRGRLQDAERLGITAYEVARSEQERFAARRLRDLSEMLRDWLDRNGINSPKQTEAVLTKVELLYTADEIAARDNFAAQMPTRETFLKAMGKGLVELFSRQSTAASRILFFNYLLLSALEAHADNLEDANFWREAAIRALGDFGPRHTAIRALEEAIDRRRDLIAGAELLNSINGAHALPTLEISRRALEENPQARTLSAASYSLRELEAAARDWSDGEFRAAGIKLENALRAIDDVELTAAITLTQYRAYVMELLSASAELHSASRKMISTIERKPDEPVEFVQQTHRHMVEVTQSLLGTAYAATLRQWSETYNAFLSVYADPTLRRSVKLTRFNDLFRAMFIDRHPAYPLYRHWYNQTESAPEFPAPPTDEPMPRITEEVDVPAEASDAPDAWYATPVEAPDIEGVDAEADARPPRRRTRGGLLILLGGIFLVAMAAVAVSGGFGGTPTVALTVTGDGESGAAVALASEEAAAVTDEVDATATTAATPSQPVVRATIPPRGSETPLPTRTPTETPLPTETPTPEPTQTFTPSATPTPSSTPTSTNTPLPTLPPEGLRGEQDLLAVAAELTNPSWSADLFSRGQDDYWRMGTGEVSPNDMLTIALPAATFERRFGNNAAARVQSVEAQMELVTWNPPLVIDNEVYFGVVFQPVNDPSRAVGVQLNLVEQGIFNVGQRIGDSVTVAFQRSISGSNARIRLERDFNSGLVAVFVNNEQVGTPIPLGDEPVIPALFMKEGQVIVHVREWNVTLR